MDLSRIIRGGKGKPPKEDKPAKEEQPPKEEAAALPAAPSTRQPPEAPPPVPQIPKRVAPVSPAAKASSYKLHRDVPTMEDMETARRLYLRLIASLRAFFEKLAATRKLEDADVEPLRKLSAEMIGPLKASPNAFLIYFCRGTAEDYLVGKHANVGVLAGRLALQLGRTDEESRELVLAGWLHDIGLAVIERLDLQPRVLSKKEKAHLMTHCEQAVPLLLGELKERQILLDACLYHHEKLDGSGYPKGLKGSAIPYFARVISVAEAYEAISHVRPYRDRQLAHEAMKQVIDQGGHFYDEPIVKALIQSLSIYPPGSYVELNNKTVARVVGINEDLPTRPLLLPVFDGMGKPVAEGAFLDLSATPLVRILRAIDETSLNLSDSKTLLQLRAQRWWTAG